MSQMQTLSCMSGRTGMTGPHNLRARLNKGGTTLFQGETWLSTWYETLAQNAEIDALIVGFADRVTGELFMLFPLSRHLENGIHIISFADFGLADYNGPLIHPDKSPHAFEADKIINALCKALPCGDLLKLEKMPAMINKHANPLQELEGLRESNLCRYGIEITGSWEDYWSGLKRNFRKDQRRRWRVLEKRGDVSFLWCRDEKQLMPLFETMLDQQLERLEGLGLTQLLADKRMKEFYRRLIQKGCADGPVIFTALLVDNVPIATPAWSWQWSPICHDPFGAGNGRLGQMLAGPSAHRAHHAHAAYTGL